MRRLPPLALTALLASSGAAQAPAPQLDLPPQTVSLADMSPFRAPTLNWRVAGDAGTTSYRSRTLAPEAGTGVLVNIPHTGAQEKLLTAWEHGDIDLSLDFMVPKGSTPSVYLMGRYAVQLSDSWGVRYPTLGDLGAIAPRWDDARGVGREPYEGVPPRLNAGRAPGLWQHLDVVFRAPRFDGTRKLASARFVKVAVNGVVVQENVEVTGPARAAGSPDEQPTGPLMLAGDQGPIAVRNIQYKSYTGVITVTGLRYRAYAGEPMNATFAATHAPVRGGDASVISSDVATVSDNFALAYDGTMSMPAPGRYRFQLDLTWIGGDSTTRGAKVGGAVLSIDGKPVLVHRGAERRASVDAVLGAGSHAFALTYYKSRPSFNRRDVALWVEGPAVERQALHDETAQGRSGTPVNPIVVAPEMEPVVLRSFVRHRGAKRVIAVSVADPVGAHYSYDLSQGALIFLWRGPFLETTQMWHSRGEDQTAAPLGSVVTLPGTPALAFLANTYAPWPDSVGDDRQFRRDGYRLDRTGHPIFLYHVRDVEVEDAIRPDSDGLSLRRELHFRGPAPARTEPLYVQIAQGAHVARQSDGTYVVGDRSFYVTLPAGSSPAIVRRQKDHDELLLPVRFRHGDARVAYSIIW